VIKAANIRAEQEASTALQDERYKAQRNLGLMKTTSDLMSAKPKSGIGHAEWQVRVDLAACYRLAELFQWTDLVYTHISARVPGTRDEFLINRFG
jgi:hypothetical protein